MLYLETFAHTVGVMQHQDAIERVAFECAEDLAADGVVYAEVRMAPELCTEAGLTLDEVMEAILDGLRRRLGGHRPDDLRHRHGDAHRGAQPARSPSSPCAGATPASSGSTSPAPRPGTRRPATSTRSSTYAENFHTTIHAGEAFGLPSIWEAVQWCGAERLGHGVRIVDDISGRRDGSEQLGRLARYVRDTRIPLELCPTSNVNTGVRVGARRAPHRHAQAPALPRHAEHRQPADERHVDERTSCSGCDSLRWSLDDFEKVAINAMKCAFAQYEERIRIFDGIDRAGYALLRAETAFGHVFEDQTPESALHQRVTVTSVVEHPLVLDRPRPLIRDRANTDALSRQNLERIGTLLMGAGNEDAPDDRQHGRHAVDDGGRPSGWPCSPSSSPSCGPGSGLGTPAQELLPEAGCLAPRRHRDHATLEPMSYNNKLPESLAGAGHRRRPDAGDRRLLVATIELRRRGRRRVTCRRPVPPRKAWRLRHPGLSDVLGAIDSHLNDHAYIVPGLGDAGDRQFGPPA